MKTATALAFLLVATPGTAMPKQEMDEIVSLMRMYTRTPAGPFKFRLESDRTRMDVRYENTKTGFRLAIVYIEPVEFVNFANDSMGTEYDGIPVALVDTNADGTIDDLKALYTKRTRRYEGMTSRRYRQNHYDSILRDIRDQLRRWINPA